MVVRIRLPIAVVLAVTRAEQVREKVQNQVLNLKPELQLAVVAVPPSDISMVIGQTVLNAPAPQLLGNTASAATVLTVYVKKLLRLRHRAA